MYIFELITKWYLKHQRKNIKNIPQETQYEKCEHVFLSLDSTNDYFACNKCGFVVENPQKKNVL